jgi:hypothetical protein
MNRWESSSDKLLLVVGFSEQDAANTKDDCQDATQKDKVEQHTRSAEDIICTDTSGSPSRLVSILHDIIMSAEMTFAIPMRYIIVEASLIARRTGTRCILRTTSIRTSSSFMLM